MTYLLDTCIISELVSKYPNSKVLDWLEEQEEHQIFLSAMTLGEIMKGIHKLQDKTKKARLAHWLEEDVTERFKRRILSIDVFILLKWGELMGEAEKKGQKLPVIDALIAATAIFHDLVVVTRNVKDLNRCGVETLNPFD